GCASPARWSSTCCKQGSGPAMAPTWPRGPVRPWPWRSKRLGPSRRKPAGASRSRKRWPKPRQSPNLPQAGTVILGMRLRDELATDLRYVSGWLERLPDAQRIPLQGGPYACPGIPTDTIEPGLRGGVADRAARNGPGSHIMAADFPGL